MTLAANRNPPPASNAANQYFSPASTSYNQQDRKSANATTAQSARRCSTASEPAWGRSKGEDNGFKVSPGFYAFGPLRCHVMRLRSECSMHARLQIYVKTRPQD